MAISGFNKLTVQATQAIDRLHALPGMGEIIAKKNFCATLRLGGDENKVLIAGPKAEDRDFTEFGSTALFSRVLHQAVDDLLSQPKALSLQERTALTQWKATAKHCLEIGAIYDHFRVRLPGVLFNFSRGNDPLGSIMTKIFGWFYSPSHSEYETVAKGIVQKIDQLKCKERMLIPYGTNTHETLLYVEKDSKGELSIKMFDPTRKNYAKVTPPQAKNINDVAWWTKVVRSKMSDGNLDEIPFKFEWLPYELGILPVQRRNTCFAHCHWNFLRFFLSENLPSKFMLSKNMPCSIEALRTLEGKIKRRVYELSCPDNEELMRVARLRLEKTQLRQQFFSSEKEVSRLTRSLLKGAKQKHYKCSQIEFSVKEIEKILKESESEFSKGHAEKKSLSKLSVHVALSNYSVLEKQLASWKRSSSSLKKSFATYLGVVNTLKKEMRAKKALQMKNTLALIESFKTPQGILAKIYRFFFLRGWQESLSPICFANGIAHNYGVNIDAFEHLFSMNRLCIFWKSLATPQEVLQSTQRIFAIAKKFKTRQHYVTYVKGALQLYIKETQFKPNDREWRKLEPQLLALSAYD